jgi:hypothetical protein
MERKLFVDLIEEEEAETTMVDIEEEKQVLKPNKRLAVQSVQSTFFFKEIRMKMTDHLEAVEIIEEEDNKQIK